MLFRLGQRSEPCPAPVITAFVGIAKEFVWDKWLKKGSFEKKDLLCDLIGIIIGCI